MRIEERQGQTATADQVLGEIRDFCRATQTAESTFGRLVVNDGKLVSRLRDGARITTGTLELRCGIGIRCGPCAARCALKSRKAAPDCPPGSFCGSRYPGPIPGAG